MPKPPLRSGFVTPAGGVRRRDGGKKMGWLVLLVVVLVVFAVLAEKLKSQGHKAEGYPYNKNQVLFSPAERSFLGVLEQAVGGEYRIFGKVRVADIVSVNSMPDRSAWQRAFNRISAKHFDFVLCSKGELAVVAVIELDDKSHQQRKRQERDAFLVGLCQAISLPLVQVPAQRAYSVPELRARVLSALGVQQEPALEPPAQAREAPEVPEVPPAQVKPQSPVAEPAETPPPAAALDVPACPKCSAPMARRQAKAGANAGQEFWGCSTFPKCRTIVPASA